MSFKNWFNKYLKEYKNDIREHGADCGFPYITYISDAVKLYDRFEDEIYSELNEDAEEFGFDSVDAFTASFRRKDMLSDPNTRKNLLIWYMCEKYANNS